MQSNLAYWELMHLVLARTDEISVVKKADKHVVAGVLSSFIW